MKKIISITLSALMLALLVVPAFAASYTVTFVQPSEAYRDGYAFVKVENGAVKFQEDPNGIYVYYLERYMTLDNIFEDYWDEVPPERYSPVSFNPTETIAGGEELTFCVFTSPVYNAATATVFVNSVKLDPSADGFYRVQVDRNLTIRVLENDENGMMGLQKNLFDVILTSGDGYNVKTVAGEGYKATPYGDDFTFRVKVKKGYSASAMKVGVARDVPEQNFLEDMESIGNLMGGNEILTSVGVDADGCRLYTVTNVTSTCKIIVTGVREDKKADILSMFLKILRKILDFLGVKIDFIDSITNEYVVSVDNQARNVTYNFIAGGTANGDGSISVMGGNSVTLQVIASNVPATVDPNQDPPATVHWTGEPEGGYTTNWVGKRDPATGETVFVANYNIDAINADTVITITDAG